MLGSVIEQTATEADTSAAHYDGDVQERRKIVDGIAHSEELRGSVHELSRYAEAFIAQLLYVLKAI